MEKSLDELLSEDTADTEGEFVDTSDHVTTTLDQPRETNGQFAANETGVEPEPSQVTETVSPTAGLPKEDYKAIRVEREKRQNLERELEALRKQIEAQQNPPAAPPTIWEDDKAWGQHLKQDVVSTAVQQATLNATLNISEMMARKSNPDFDDMKARFLELGKANPSLVEQALNDPDPWGKAYTIAKNAATMEELGATDIETLKAKIREELAAEMQGNTAPRQTVPLSLTNERNVGSRSGPSWTGPKPLSELLG